jgi:hypothetical protein
MSILLFLFFTYSLPFTWVKTVLMLVLLSVFPAFGIVYAARDLQNIRGDGKRHYAVKLTSHTTLLCTFLKGHTPEMGKWCDGPDNQIHYIPEEAIWMLFLRNSDRFPAIDSVYTHGEVQAIVMSAVVDYNPERENISMMAMKRLGEYSAVTGRELVKGKATDLNEKEVQKIASQIVEAWVYLMDMNLAHHDFGLQNFAVSEKLDVSFPLLMTGCNFPF